MIVPLGRGLTTVGEVRLLENLDGRHRAGARIHDVEPRVILRFLPLHVLQGYKGYSQEGELHYLLLVALRLGHVLLFELLRHLVEDAHGELALHLAPPGQPGIIITINAIL